MKGKWEVTFNPLAGDTPYGVVRLINTDEVDHSGNREYHACGYMANRAEAAAIAERLNVEEDQ